MSLSYNPEARVGRRADQKRRWDRESRTPCICGALKARNAELCRACADEAKAERKREMRSDIRSCWMMGMKTRDIAARHEMSVKSMASEMSAMRREGWDLPYRRPDNLERLTGRWVR